jgi:hypothetical protein
MAIFERKYEHKIELDDTEALICKIETHQTLGTHTVSNISIVDSRS